jgi:hypothetical protein
MVSKKRKLKSYVFASLLTAINVVAISVISSCASPASQNMALK